MALNTYVAFYNRKSVTVQAATSYDAQLIAAAKFKVAPSKSYVVTVVLAEKDGKPVPVNVSCL